MMFHGIYRFKTAKDRIFYPLAIWLANHRINANVITLLGLISGMIAAFCLLFQQSFWGLCFILVNILADMLDGTLARLRTGTDFWGKIFDSLSDRIVETGCMGTMIISGLAPWWGWFLPVSSIILFILRIWAYQKNIDSSMVFIARFERMAAIIVLILIPWRLIAQSILFLVILGTFLSNLILMKAIVSNHNTKSHLKTAIGKRVEGDRHGVGVR